MQIIEITNATANAELNTEMYNSLKAMIAKMDATEVRELKKEGWVDSIHKLPHYPSESRDLYVRVSSVMPLERNYLCIMFNVIDRSSPLFGIELSYMVYLSNKHMLCERFKEGSELTLHLVQNEVLPEIAEIKTRSGKKMYASEGYVIVNRLYVKKPGRK